MDKLARQLIQVNFDTRIDKSIMKDAFFDEMDHILANITDKYSIKPEDIGPWHNPPETPVQRKSSMVDPEDAQKERRK